METERTRPQPSGAAFAGFVCGLLGMIFSTLWVAIVPFGIALDLVAIGLALLGRFYASRDPRVVSGSSMALAGLVLGAIGLTIGIISLALFG